MKRHIHRIGMIFLVSTLALCVTPFVKAQQDGLSFWTTEIEPKRMAIQKGIAKEFNKVTGIEVEIVPVEESALPTRVLAAAAANALPDLILVPLEYVITWVEEGILDPKAARSVIETMGVTSFALGPLTLAALQDGWGAVPADGWGQLLLFRKDLFASSAPDKWLGRPDTWETILAAAQVLHDPPKLRGIGVGTDPTQVYTQQVFEQFALTNAATLVDPCSGEVDLNTPEFVQTLKYYKKLAGFSPPGNVYWRQTREDYFGGRLAMIMWSPFILDELAGLRDDVPVTAGELARPLHKMTGVVTAFKGPLGPKPAQWGQVSYLGITKGADPNVKKFAQFVVGEGYLTWLSMAPEGKFPLRPAFIDGWKQLKIGVDRTASIAELYPSEVIESIVAGVDNFDRWGFAAGQGACVGKIYGTKEVIRILRRYLDGEFSADAAAKAMTEAVRAFAEGS